MTTRDDLPADRSGIEGPTGTILDGVIDTTRGVLIDGVLWTEDSKAPQWVNATIAATLTELSESLSMLLGLELQPKRPTVREAFVDACDALRTLLCVLVTAVRSAVRRAGGAVADRWELLRERDWRRLRGPVLRFWSHEFVLLHTVRDPWVEPRRDWLRRQGRFVLWVVRNG